MKNVWENIDIDLNFHNSFDPFCLNRYIFLQVLIFF